MAVGNKLYTVEEFDEFLARPENRDRRFELFSGEIVELTPTQLQGYAGGNLFAYLWNFNDQHRLGRLMMEASYRMPGDEHNRVIPDISYLAGYDTPVVRQGDVPRMPDLAVEVKSPDNSMIQLRDKAAYYLANGCRLVWLVWPEKQLVEVYRAGADVDILTVDDTLDGGDVLPGFGLTLRDLFGEP